MLHRCETYIVHLSTFENGACPGVEPGTSRTRSANHTTRPTGQCSFGGDNGTKAFLVSGYVLNHEAFSGRLILWQ